MLTDSFCLFPSCVRVIAVAQAMNGYNSPPVFDFKRDIYVSEKEPVGKSS